MAALFHGFDHTRWTTGTATERLALLPKAVEHVLRQEDGKARLLKGVSELSQAFALAVPHEAALSIRDDVAFFQAVRSTLAKSTVVDGRTGEDLDHAVRQLVSKAVTPDGVVDIFAAAGLPRPDISILSDDFLSEVRGLPHKNLAVELLRKLLNDEIRTRSRKQLVQARSFAAMLERAVRTYQNRAVETAQVIEELIELAREMRQAQKRGEALGLSDEELAFYDALIAHGEEESAPNGRTLREARAEYEVHPVSNSVVRIMGDETLRTIARELVDTVRRNTTVDWTVKETVRARLRVMVKRVLRKYGYPPDKQEKATQTVLEQAELFGDEWATSLAAP